MDRIRANISDWSKRIRPNKEEQMRERIAERRIFHFRIVHKVDKTLGGKERQFFEEKEI